MRHIRANLLLTAWICILSASGLALSGPDPIVLAIAMPLGIAGVVLLVFGIRAPSEQRVDLDALRSWAPDELPMRDAGRVMYRIDTLLDEPIRTSILCGRCGKLTWCDGKKPATFTCGHCDTELWDDSEE
jgi:hypothetical protein